MIMRALVVVSGLVGAVAASQIPELMQQYRQRLGGAVEELARVVADFDLDAAREDLTRDQALERYITSGDRFFNRRGVSMQRTLARFDRITAHRAALLDADAFERPVLFWTYNDPVLLDGTVGEFRPAIPTTAEGAVYASGGFVLGAVLMALLLGILRRIGRLFRRPARVS